jgi:hypothetical protein
MRRGIRVTGALAGTALVGVLGVAPVSSQTPASEQQPAYVNPQPVAVVLPPGKVEGRVAMLDESSQAQTTLWLENGAQLRIADVAPTSYDILRPGSYVSAVVDARDGLNVVTDLRIEPELQAP